jgi:hypothetical protein
MFTSINIYHLLKRERLSVGTKLTVYRVLIMSILIHVCPAWKFAADSHLLKLQRLQVLRTIGNLLRRTPTRDLHVAFGIQCLYDFVTKLCRQQATVMLNNGNGNMRSIGQGEARRTKYKRHKLGGIRHTIDCLDSRMWLYPWAVYEQ